MLKLVKYQPRRCLTTRQPKIKYVESICYFNEHKIKALFVLKAGN